MAALDSYYHLTNVVAPNCDRCRVSLLNVRNDRLADLPPIFRWSSRANDSRHAANKVIEIALFKALLLGSRVERSGFNGVANGFLNSLRVQLANNVRGN